MTGNPITERRVRLEGDGFDLEAAAKRFGRGAGSRFEIACGDDGGYFITSKRYLELVDGNDVIAAAQRDIDVVNGMVRLARPDFQPIRLAGVIVTMHQDGNAGVNIIVPSVQVTSRVGEPTVLVNGQPTDHNEITEIQRWTAKADADSDTTEAITIFGKQPEFPDLYKIFEIVRRLHGGGANMFDDLSDDAQDKAELRKSIDNFTRDAQQHRHSRPNQPARGNPMLLKEASAIIGDLLRRHFRWSTGSPSL